ncbi:unnamed protein product, partial [Gulo gulo]
RRGRDPLRPSPIWSLPGSLWSGPWSHRIRLWGNCEVTQTLGSRRNGAGRFYRAGARNSLHRGSSFSAHVFLK